jgi:hypothetical protein
MALSTTMVCRYNLYHALMLKTYFPFVSLAHLAFLLHFLSVLEVVQFQHTLLGLHCLEESGRLL